MKTKTISMKRILEITTGKGRLKEGQFVMYKGESISVYSIVDLENITAFYPEEDGALITIPINELNL